MGAGVRSGADGADGALWDRVHSALLKAPHLGYAEIAKQLRNDPKIHARWPSFDQKELEKVIDRFGGRQETWAERDRAVAEKLAKEIKKLPEGTPLATIAREVAGVIPGLADHDLKRLMRRHGDILGGLSARSIHKPVPPAARARIAELALANPTLDYAQLAKLFAKDPKIGDVLKWSEEEVSRLREPSRILPSEAKRSAALAKIAAKHLGAVKAGESLDGAIEGLAKTHPNVTREILMKLAPREPALADAIRRIEKGEAKGADTAKAKKPAALEIDLALARKIDAGPATIARSLARTPAGVVAKIQQELVHHETHTGNSDGKLAPSRDLAKASPLLLAVMEEAYQLLGGRGLLDLEKELWPKLPAAIAEVARKGRLSKDPILQQLFLDATRETVAELSAAYRDEVIEKGLSPTAFSQDRKLKPAFWTQLRKMFKEHFPEPGDVALTGKRLEAVADLYRRLLDGEITTGAFYARARITPAQLRVLQTTEPDLFPRQEGAKSWKTVVGRRNLDKLDLDLKTLSKAWHEEVLSGLTSRAEFAKKHGYSIGQFKKFEENYPALFPKVGSVKGGDYTDEDLAKAWGKAALAIFNKDPLIKFDGLIEAMNRDEKLVEQFGPVTANRYWIARGVDGSLFPSLKDPNAILPILAKEVRALLAKKGVLTPRQITSEMKKAHPNFKLSRVYQLAATIPNLIPEVGPPTVGMAVRRKDAERLAAEQTKHPEKTLVEISAEWGPKAKRFTLPYLHRLRKDFAKDVFAASGAAFERRTLERTSRPVLELLNLAVRLAPPGTSDAALGEILDRILVQRGLPPFDSGLPSSIEEKLGELHGSIAEQHARSAGEIFAEYARAAKKGASEQEIFDAVREDYPTIDAWRFQSYKKRWLADPKAHHSIQKFLVGGELKGGGGVVESPRYIGGWDPFEAVIEPAKKDPAQKLELARASQYARMSLRLPMLDEMVAELGGKKPLAHTNLLWVTHLLGTSLPLANALHAAGVKTAATIVVGTPYGTNDAVREAFASQGYDVRKPALDPDDYPKKVRKAVDDMVERCRKNHEPVVVLDDGGLVTKILHENRKKYADVIGMFKIVEQTTRGITELEQIKDLETPVVNVARSKTKGLEGEMIGRAVAAKMLQGLDRIGKSVKDRPVTVIGYGIVGSALAQALKKAGAIVTVVEPSPERAAEAAGPPHHFKVRPKEKALEKAEFVIGATGNTSLELEDLKQLPPGAVVCSASSKQLEIEMKRLGAEAKKREEIPSDNPLVALPTVEYQLGNKKITVLGDGWPINFDGDVEDLPAEEIQVTRALMFAGALQAAKIKPHHESKKRILDLDEDVDAKLYARYRELEKKRKHLSPIGDPSKWEDPIVALAGDVLAVLEEQAQPAS